MAGAALGETRRLLLLALKQHGPATLAELGERVPLAAATLREHLQNLMALHLAERCGTRKREQGRGRPEVVYGLSAEAEGLFPAGEGDLLQDLIGWLSGGDRQPLLEQFFATRNAGRLAAGRRRLAGLEGRERLQAVAAILSEEGYMAEVHQGADAPVLRLCHCPLRSVTGASSLPCRAEIALVQGLVGAPLRRTAWMPDGDHTCEYTVGASDRSPSTHTTGADR